MSQTFTLENMLRVHDRAIYEWLGELKVDYGDIAGNDITQSHAPILRQMASPMRAFAIMAKLLIRKGWIKRPTDSELLTDARAHRIVPLPFVSIFREAPEHDPQRAAVPLAYRGLVYDPATGLKQNHPYPGAFLINYQVDFWMLKKYTEAYIYEWIMSFMGRPGAAHNEYFLTVNHEFPWFKKLQAIKLTSFSDNSDLEDIETQRRFIRFTAQIQMNALLFRPGEDQNVVMQVSHEEFDANFADARTGDPGPLLDPATMPAEFDAFPDKGILDAKDVSGLFFVEGADVTVKRTGQTSDGRFDVFRRRFKNNEYGSFEIAYTGSSTFVGNRLIRFPVGRNSGVVRFLYKSLDDDAVLELVDDSDDAVQTWVLPRTSRWTQFEAYLTIDPGFRVRWRYASTGSLFLDRVKISLLASVVGVSIAPTSDVVVGPDRVITFTGLNHLKMYLVSGDLVDTVSEFDVVVQNNDNAPTDEDRISVGVNRWKTFAFVQQPTFGNDSILIRLEGSTSALSNIEVREYTGRFLGRFVTDDSTPELVPLPIIKVFTDFSIRRNYTFESTVSTFFDGVDSYARISFPHKMDFEIDDAFSVSFWMRILDTPTGVHALMGNSESSGWYVFHRFFGTPLRSLIDINLIGTSDKIQVSGQTFGVADGWINFVITYDGSELASGVNHYQNGSLSSKTVLRDKFSGTLQTGGDALIGARTPSSPSLFAENNLDELAVFDAELNATQISAIYNSGKPANLAGHANLIHWWRMGEFSTHPTLVDSAPGGTNATMINMSPSDFITDVP